MRKTIVLFLLFFSFSLVAQKPELAKTYFVKGEYEKAIVLYRQLHEKTPIRRDYFKALLTCYQQLEKYELAEILIRDQIKRFPNQINLNIEVGYNYQLQNENEKANKYYEKALSFIKTKPNYGFSIGHAFKQNHLLDYALKAYSIAKLNNPKLNTEMSEAQIYGEMGDLKKMFESYLNLIQKDEKYYATIQRYIATFITDDNKNETNILFKKLVLKRAQNNPNDSWNILLSWLYMQQKEYNKAFVQEKSLFYRNQESLIRITEVAKISFDYGDFETSTQAFNFILNNTQSPKASLQAQMFLLQMDVEKATKSSEHDLINKKYQDLIEHFSKNISTIDLQISYAEFLTFTYNQPEKAIKILKALLPFANSSFQRGAIKIKLADIFVYSSQFNQALILYSQVQSELKNSPLAQTARFKVAQTSYFKGDFKWAQIQLKVLKSSTSQLISNDALELNLLISNNIENDSVFDALKNYATADLLSFQNKNEEAIKILENVLTEFKGQNIEDDALFKQAKLYIKIKKYAEAENNYLKIIEIDKEGILIDDSYFYLAELYANQLNDLEKAKTMYQKIVFNHPSSIYLIEARKKYRKLRGEDIDL